MTATRISRQVSAPEMTITISLADAEGRSSLAKLAALVEAASWAAYGRRKARR